MLMLVPVGEDIDADCGAVPSPALIRHWAGKGIDSGSTEEKCPSGAGRVQPSATVSPLCLGSIIYYSGIVMLLVLSSSCARSGQDDEN
jgi:hypothetical protein